MDRIGLPPDHAPQPESVLFTKLIDSELAKLVRPARFSSMATTDKSFPRFRLADFHKAREEFVRSKTMLGRVDSAHYEDLNQLMSRGAGPLQRELNSAPIQMTEVAYREKEGIPEDSFLAFRDTDKRLTGIIRIRKRGNVQVGLEVAVNRTEMLQPVLNELVELSIQHSVFRNQLVAIEFEESFHDEYSSMQAPHTLNVAFRRDPEITADQIVLAKDVEEVLERNVVSFHKNREHLKELGVPLQRGILLHGPPGTGKTYTCQYLYGRLKPVTMIVVSGKGLTEVKSICNFARMLQPSVVVLEDVDLVFTSREINLYSTGLGDMMDELDGFKNDDAVTFILTTNAIERLEAAVKDRPGRISQCVFFGPPTQELRARYLAHFLRHHDCSKLSMDRLAEISEGGSQAFLQELVYRAIQIGAERISNGDKLLLEEVDFEAAMQEMTGFTEQATASIIGFRK